MQRQKIVVFIIAFVLALISVGLIKIYLDGQRKATEEELQKKLDIIKTKIQTDQIPVLIAKDNIPEGTTITADLLDIRTAPAHSLDANVISSLEKAVGMVAVRPIAKDEPLTARKISFSQKGEAADINKSLSGLTPLGKRAITIIVDNISGLSGMLKPGDYVDVLASLPLPVRTPDGKQANTPVTVPLFQNILVLAVGQETIANSYAQQTQQDSRYKKEDKSQQSLNLKEASPVTLALTPQEASLIAFVQEQGKVRLVLRSPTDSNIQPVAPATWDTLLQYIMPPKEDDSKKNEPHVEIYRGLNKEDVPLGK
jgi:pilus assembly protein CpaB